MNKTQIVKSYSEAIEDQRSFQVILSAGQWTGFILSLTYPTAGTVTQWSEQG